MESMSLRMEMFMKDSLGGTWWKEMANIIGEIWSYGIVEGFRAVLSALSQTSKC